jgi:hypothetical protein
LLLQSFGIPAIHGGQMCRHRSSTQVLDRWSKPTTASSAQRGEKAQDVLFHQTGSHALSPRWQESVPCLRGARAASASSRTEASLFFLR